MPLTELVGMRMGFSLGASRYPHPSPRRAFWGR